MRIAWHMPTLRASTCGLSRRAVEFASRLAAAGHSIHFFVEGSKTDVRVGEIEGVPVTRIATDAAHPIHWSLQARSRVIAAADCVRTIPPGHELFISCQPEAVTVHAAMRAGVPVVFVCGGTTLLHDGADQAGQAGGSTIARIGFCVDRWLKHRNERRAFAAADAVVFDSDHTRRRVIDGYAVRPDKCHTVYGGVDAARFAPSNSSARAAARTSLGLRPDDFVVTWTGRLSPEKNLTLLLNAVAVSKPRPDRVLLVGDGPEKAKLQELIASAGLRSVVHLAGARNDVRPYLHAADVFAFPSRGESFGGSLAEAMACGLPCIAVRPDGVEIRNASLEALDEGRCGVLVNNDPHDLAEALRRLRTDVGLRKELGARARQRVEDHFTWDRGTVALERILTHALSGADGSNAAARKPGDWAIAQKLPTFSEATT